MSDVAKTTKLKKGEIKAYPDKRALYLRDYDTAIYDDLARETDLLEEVIHATDRVGLDENNHLYGMPNDLGSDLRFKSEQRAKSLVGVRDMIKRGFDPNNTGQIYTYLQQESLPNSVRLLLEQFHVSDVVNMLKNMKVVGPIGAGIGIGISESSKKQQNK